MNRTLPSQHGGSLKFTLTVPLKDVQKPPWRVEVQGVPIKMGIERRLEYRLPR